jgi:hypothetical protein
VNYNFTSFAVAELRNAVLEGKYGIHPRELYIAGASYIYQTTQFPDSGSKYHNYYLLARVESYFGTCCHTPKQLDMRAAEELSGNSPDKYVGDSRLPVSIAALDAYFGVMQPHTEHCSNIAELPVGTPV